MYKKQKGFAHIALILVVLVVFAVGGVGYYVFNENSNKSSDSASGADSISSEKSTSEDGPTIKHLGVNLDYYDPATNKAGDFEFTKANFDIGIQLLFTDFGYTISGQISSTGQDKSNPQPTFILPLGSKVYSLVDGEVHDVPKLYSNDYSVMVQAEGSDLIFETEHVINVKVKKGDKVKAGQEVAEVSGYDAHGYAGLGLVEIGILRGGNPPFHICPFDYLDKSIKEETIKKINALKKSWEEYRGDTSLYDESKEVTPGCLTSEPIEG